MEEDKIEIEKINNGQENKKNQIEKIMKKTRKICLIIAVTCFGISFIVYGFQFIIVSLIFFIMGICLSPEIMNIEEYQVERCKRLQTFTY